MRTHKIVRGIGTVLCIFGMLSQVLACSMLGVYAIIASTIIQGDYLEERLDTLDEDNHEMQ